MRAVSEGGDGQAGNAGDRDEHEEGQHDRSEAVHTRMVNTARPMVTATPASEDSRSAAPCRGIWCRPAFPPVGLVGSAALTLTLTQAR